MAKIDDDSNKQMSSHFIAQLAVVKANKAWVIEEETFDTVKDFVGSVELKDCVTW